VGNVTNRVTASIFFVEICFFPAIFPPMSTRNHDRAPDKSNFSIALPKLLKKQLQGIAKIESRSRNRQIEKMLTEAVRDWESRNGMKIRVTEDSKV
jgi:hypothetical protein